MTTGELVLWAGLIIGLAFGICGQLTGFCLMSGLRGWWVEGDGRKIRAFALAGAVAILGSQMLDALTPMSLTQSLYVQGTFSIPMVVLGGALFGYGMVMSNGCGARSLVLLGQGNLRSFLVLVCLGLAAGMTLTGLIAPLRVAGNAASSTGVGVSPANLPGLIGALGVDANIARWVLVALVSGGLAAFALKSAAFRADPKALSSGIVIGILIPAGWYVTGILGYDDFDPTPLASFTFIAPIGDAIQYAMLATGTRLSFGVAIVIGVFLGALASALLTRTAKIEGFTRPRSMIRYMLGGALMGCGGALALGCSIGQGLTGLSTLALTSFVAIAGILAGAAMALRGPVRLPAPQP
ncbi:YeeE/YedE family protein [Pelagibacterium lentulum]|uniref:Membrane protein n=1 Tax=Pelagibacterium lentulum TaxID=2029865 RepID=A0A916VZW9_9HYPH|nr:YeeE/YedE family protein [Pelagibacterium lentulum]GGA55010.1 membrane protein [Pelagibacterium lentulum]